MSFSLGGERFGPSFNPEKNLQPVAQAELLGTHWWEVAYNRLFQVLSTQPDHFPVTKMAWRSLIPDLISGDRLQGRVEFKRKAEKRTTNTFPGKAVSLSLVVNPLDVDQSLPVSQQQRFIEGGLSIPIAESLRPFLVRIETVLREGVWRVKLDLDLTRLTEALLGQPENKQIWAVPKDTCVIIGRKVEELADDQVALQFPENGGLSRRHLALWVEQDPITLLSTIHAQDLKSANASYRLLPDEDSYESIHVLWKSLAHLLPERMIASHPKIRQVSSIVRPNESIGLIRPSVMSSWPMMVQASLSGDQLIIETANIKLKML